MTRTEELLALAAAATPGPWESGEFSTEHWEKTNHKHFVMSNLRRVAAIEGLGYQSDAAFIAAANPEIIKQLIELVRLQHEALITCDVDDVKYPDDTQFYDNHKVEKAIEAFNKWEPGK